MQHVLLQERLRGAIWGQFIGDAIFNYKKYEKNAQKDNLNFKNPIASRQNPSQDVADLTHYGDAALVLLNSLVHQHGFSARDFGTSFVETFASPDYLNPIDKTTKKTIENYHLSLEEGHPDLGYEFQGGANSADIDSATRLAPLLALYWDDTKLFSIVDRATRVTQNNELAIAYMRSYARTLRSLFQGEDLHQIFSKETMANVNDTPLDHHVREKIKQALQLGSLSIIEAVKQLGTGSHLDQSYPSAIQAALKYRESFKNAILDTMKAGGDCAGRASLAGTWLGAHLGLAAIPQEWRQSLGQRTAIENGIEAIMGILT